MVAKEWDALTGDCLHVYKGVLSARYSSDGKSIVFAYLNKIIIRNADTGQIIKEIKAERESFSHAVISPDGKKIAAVSSRFLFSEKCSIKIWNADNLKMIAKIDGLNEFTISDRIIEFSHDGKKILFRTSKTIWNAETGTEICHESGYNCDYPITSFSSIDDLFVTGFYDTINLFSANTGKQIYTMSSHSNFITYTTFSPDGRFIISSSRDGVIKIWNARTGKVEKTIQGRGKYVRHAVYSPKENIYAVASDDLDVKIFDASTNILKMVLDGHKAVVASLSFSSDGTLLSTTSLDNTAKVWEVKTGRLLNSFNNHEKCVDFASFNHTNTKLVTVSEDTTARVWDLAKDCELFSIIAGAENGIETAFFSEDDTMIIIANNIGEVSVYDAQNGNPLLLCDKNHRMSMGYANFLNHDTEILFFYRSTIRILERKTGKFVKKIVCKPISSRFRTGFGNYISWIDYNKETHELTVSYRGGGIEIRDADSGQVKMTLVKDKKQGSTEYFCYSPDRKKLLVTSRGEALLLDANTGKQLDSVKSIPGLIVIDCEMRSLHPKSNISRENIENLRRYGAII